MGMRTLTPATMVAAMTGALLLAGAGAAMAGASSSPWRQPAAPAQADGRPGLVRMADGRICERMCPQDTLPCDPINFKIADGRCRGVMNAPR